MITVLNTLVWEGFFLPAVLVGGVYLTFGTRFFQLRALPRALLFFRKRPRHVRGVSPFQALCTALGGTMGTGSVLGTCQALVMGGFGAIFWMWIAAFLGMIVKCAEVTLSLAYRHRDEAGRWQGGPMYYLRDGLHCPRLARVWAILALLSAFGMGNLSQSASMAHSARNALSVLFPFGAAYASYVGVGLCLAAAGLLAVILYGKGERTGRFVTVLVPFCALGFLAVCFLVIASHASRLLPTLRLIVQSALSPRALTGAGGGICVRQAVAWGLRRSAFSNEAGLGTAAIVHASAETDHPVRQGLCGIFEVFFDTVVICTATAVTVAVALPAEQIQNAAEAGAALLPAAVSTVFSAPFAAFFTAFSLGLLAFSTLLAWAVYGASVARFLFGKKAERIFRPLFLLCVPLGAVLPLEKILLLADTFNGLMAIPNFIALFFLSRSFFSLVRSFPPSPPAKKAKKSFDIPPPL